MNWKPKYYIIYPSKMVDELKWPDHWGYRCAGNLPGMLREVLNVKRGIGSEIKLIWNEQHRWQVIKDHNVTNGDLEDYIKADCSLLSFKTEFLMKRAVKALKKMGLVSEIVCVDNYRDVILQQADFKRNGHFIITGYIINQPPSASVEG